MKKQMERKASDNIYLHKDFHEALNFGLFYLEERFGIGAIEEYLTDYAENYFLPKTLSEIKVYLQDLYEAEGTPDAVEFAEQPGKLHVNVRACPALAFIKTPMPHYRMTTEIIYGVLARKSGLNFTLHYYNDQTGAASFTFEEATV